MKTIKTKAQFLKAIIAIGACREGINWVERQNVETAEEVWLRIRRNDWIWWLLDESGTVNLLDTPELRQHLWTTWRSQIRPGVCNRRQIPETRPLVELPYTSVPDNVRYLAERLHNQAFGSSVGLERVACLRLCTLTRSWVSSVTLHSLDPRVAKLLRDDVRHVIGWDDIAPSLRAASDKYK